MKQLVICPHCEEQGKKNILAAIEGNKIIILRRTHTTVIIAKECVLMCGDCNKTVFRKVNNEKGK